MKTIINTSYDTIAARDESGIEYIVIPVFEDGKIEAYRLPNDNAKNIAGKLTLPEDAEYIDSYTMDDCEDAYAVYEKCDRLIQEI